MLRLVGSAIASGLPPDVIWQQAGAWAERCDPPFEEWEKHVEYECPARLSEAETRAIEKVGRATFASLECRDFARVDTGDVHDHEVGRIDALGRNEPVRPTERRIELAAEEEIDPGNKDRCHAREPTIGCRSRLEA